MGNSSKRFGAQLSVRLTRRSMSPEVRSRSLPNTCSESDAGHSATTQIAQYFPHEQTSPSGEAFAAEGLVDNLRIDGCYRDLLGIGREDLSFLIHVGLVGILMEDVIECDLAVLFYLLVGDPLRIIGSQVFGLGVHLHLSAGGPAPDLSVDVAIVRHPLLKKDVTVCIVLKLHVECIIPVPIPEPDRGVETRPDVGQLCGVRV